MYWKLAGEQNTESTVKAAVDRAIESGIRYIVVASNTGRTIKAATDLIRDHAINLIAVTHHTGFKAPGYQEMPQDVVSELTSQGVKFLTTTHLFGGVERAIANKFGGLYPEGIIANTLRMFSQGMKVAVEVATMALDAGLIPYGEEVIAVGGTSSGADTAIVIRPAHAKDFFDGEILEIICKPRTVKTPEN